MSAPAMPEVHFYHLTRRKLEQALPILLEKTLARSWRAAVQAVSARRLAVLDEALWSYRPESFLPHGGRGDGAPETQPVYLTTEDDNPNRADARFFVEGARAAPLLADAERAPRERAVLVFEEADRANAREQWKELLSTGRRLSYWQEDETGKFLKVSEKN